MRVVVYKSRRLYSLAALVACLVLAVGVCCYSIMSCFAQQEKLLPVYRVRTNEQKIALTFDVAWGDSDLDEILDVLEQNDAKATFFTTGECHPTACVFYRFSV